MFEKRARTDQQKWRLPCFAGHVLRSESEALLNSWFSLDKRYAATKNRSGLANSRASYIKVVTNVIE